MADFLSNDELLAELDSVDVEGKIPAFAGRRYPIEYLDSREFERLIYFITSHSHVIFCYYNLKIYNYQFYNYE